MREYISSTSISLENVKINILPFYMFDAMWTILSFSQVNKT